MSQITNSIEEAVNQLLKGEIVAIPTETVYGLAGNAEDTAAIKKIYALKNRPLSHPLIMHVGKDWDLSRWVMNIPDYAQTLMDAFWPGPLTLVFNSRQNVVNPLITGNQPTVAIRCPNHPIAQSLLQTLNFPLVAPSANPFGKISPTTANHVYQSFQDESLLILDGGRSSIGIESTIIDATHPLGYQILRAGTINKLSIEKYLPLLELNIPNSTRVPGKLASHYQPEKPLFSFENQHDMHIFCKENSDVYVLSFHKDELFANYKGYQLPFDAKQFAYELYFQLRVADKSPASILVIELPPAEEAWLGIRERILKASWV